MKQFRVLSYFFAVLTGLFFIHTAQASPILCSHPKSFYVEFEPFLAKVETGFSDLRFAEVANPSSSNNRNEFHLNDDDNWDFGWRVAIGYDFASCRPTYWGLSLEYTYYDVDNDAHTPVLLNERNRGILVPSIGPFTFDRFTDAKASLDTTYRAADLIAHYYIPLCRCIKTELFAGLRYIQLEEDLDVRYHFASSTPALFAHEDNLSVSLEDEFKGIGPRLGVGIYYPFTKCIGITGDVAGNFLYGDHDRHLRGHAFETINGEANFVSDSKFSKNHDDHEFVPGISAHVGLAYQVSFCNCSCLGFEAGYRYDRYFNLEQDTFNCSCDCNHKTSRKEDIEFQGPYVKLAWHF